MNTTKKKKPDHLLTGLNFLMAEREGFEPSVQVIPTHSLSRRAPSATRPSLRICFRGGESRI